MLPAGAPQGSPHVAAALSARNLAAFRDDEGGDVLGGFAGHLGQHGGIGVGGPGQRVTPAERKQLAGVGEREQLGAGPDGGG
jgi:hypothetical protein